MNCIACDSNHLTKVHENLLKCRKCNTLQRENPNEYYEKIKTVYNENYFSERYKKRHGKDIQQDVDNIKKIATRRIEIIENLLLRESECERCNSNSCDGCYVRNLVKSLKNRKLLDIGCGSGIFLEVAKSRSFKVKGIDFNTHILHILPESVREDVIIRDFLEYETDEKFDVVTMFFVIEHMPNVREVLNKVWKMLKYGGILAISTPNSNGFTASLKPENYYSIIPEDHLYEFSVKGLTNLLQKNNFRIAIIINTGFHPERVTNNKFLLPLVSLYQKIKNLGDTFEIYAVKKLP